MLNYLIDNEYIIRKEGEWYVTDKLSNVTDALPTKTLKEQITGKELYKEFIKQAEIPRFLTLNTGQRYYVNQYSKSGERTFTRIIKNPKIDNQLFLFSTKLYYKSNISNKCTISNYLTKGIWETQYEELVEKVKNGHVNLQQYLRDQTNDGERLFEKGI